MASCPDSNSTMVSTPPSSSVDPVPMKLEVAKSLGATHTASSMAEALPLIREITHGYLAEKVIMTPSVMYGELLGEGLSLVGKGGTLVCTAVAPMSQTTPSINLFEIGDVEQRGERHDLWFSQSPCGRPESPPDVSRRIAQAR